MGEMLTEFTQNAVVEAMEANLATVFACVARHAPGGEVIEGAEMLQFLTGIRHPMMNGVLRAQLPPKRLDAAIAETLDSYRARNLPMSWTVGPSTRPADLGARLQERGLANASKLPGMAIDLQTLSDQMPLPPGLAITEVSDSDALQCWTHAFAVGFGFTEDVATATRVSMERAGLGADRPLRHFLATQEGQPVACSSLYLDSGVAGIYCVATVPEARRQGIGAAITGAACRAARDAGYHIATLQASKMGEPIYQRLGLQECCRFQLYVSPWGMTDDG